VSSASGNDGYDAVTTAPAAANTGPADSTTDATAASTSNAPPRSTDSATRMPSSDPERGGANVEPGSERAFGTRRSGPATTDSRSARSETDLAMGPPTEVVSQAL
jgi:hypothetical protein